MYHIVKGQLEEYTGPEPTNLLSDQERGTEDSGGSWAPLAGSGVFGFGDIWAVDPYVGTKLWRLFSNTAETSATVAVQKPISTAAAPYVVTAKLQLGVASADASARVGLRVQDVDTVQTIIWGPSSPLIAGEWVEYRLTVVASQLPNFPVQAGPVIGITGTDSEVFFR